MNAMRLVQLLAKTARIAGGLAQNAGSTARENTSETVSNGTFRFKLVNNKSEYEIYSFLKSSDPSVTNVTVPAEYNGIPVRILNACCFSFSEFLTSVIISDGVEEIGPNAFEFCPSLEKVYLPQSIRRVYEGAFRECPLLPAETVMTCLCQSPDITQPFCEPWGNHKFNWDDALREDVFVLALKNHSFSNFGREKTLEEITKRGIWKYLLIMKNAGFFSDIERLNGYIEESVRNNTPEITAMLLEYKNRYFGFEGGNDFEL